MKSISPKEHKWDIVITGKTNLFDLGISEIWAYRDLLFLLVKRDYIAFYKQTILGPIWFFLQPLMTMAIFVLIFSKLAGLSTDGIPAPLFYLVGIVAWNYFAECLNKTATVFRDNAEIFGKVYFPRLILPLSIVLSSLVRFSVQLLLLVIILLYYIFFRGYPFVFGPYLLLLPVFITLMALFGLGIGMFISALTTKYRDLIFLVTFGVQLFMYATPVIYPYTYPSNETVRMIIGLNPLTPIFEGLRLAILGKGYFEWSAFLYATIFIAFLLIVGSLIFNKTEKDFIDTV